MRIGYGHLGRTRLHTSQATAPASRASSTKPSAPMRWPSDFGVRAASGASDCAAGSGTGCGAGAGAVGGAGVGRMGAAGRSFGGAADGARGGSGPAGRAVGAPRRLPRRPSLATPSDAGSSWSAESAPGRTPARTAAAPRSPRRSRNSATPASSASAAPPPRPGRPGASGARSLIACGCLCWWPSSSRRPCRPGTGTAPSGSSTSRSPGCTDRRSASGWSGP